MSSPASISYPHSGQTYTGRPRRALPRGSISDPHCGHGAVSGRSTRCLPLERSGSGPAGSARRSARSRRRVGYRVGLPRVRPAAGTLRFDPDSIGPDPVAADRALVPQPLDFIWFDAQDHHGITVGTSQRFLRHARSPHRGGSARVRIPPLRRGHRGLNLSWTGTVLSR